MLKSEVTLVSMSSFKRSHRTPISSSESNDDDDENEPQRSEDEKEESEVQSKQTSNPSLNQTTPAPPPRTGGLYMPPAKLRLLQVRLFHITLLDL